MWRTLLFLFCISALLISAFGWYYVGGEQNAFNTGLYFVLSFWALNKAL